MAQETDLFTLVYMSNLSAPAFCHLYSSSEMVLLPCLLWLFSDAQLGFSQCFCCMDSHYPPPQPFESPWLSVRGRTALILICWSQHKRWDGCSLRRNICGFITMSLLFFFFHHLLLLPTHLGLGHGTELVFPVALSKVQVRHTQARAPSYVQEPVGLISSCENELNGFQGHLISENCFCAT